MTSLLKKLSISIKIGAIKRYRVRLVSFQIVDRIRRRRCELVANCVHTADATKQFRLVGVGGVHVVGIKVLPKLFQFTRARGDVYCYYPMSIKHKYTKSSGSAGCHAVNSRRPGFPGCRSTLSRVTHGPLNQDSKGLWACGRVRSNVMSCNVSKTLLMRRKRREATTYLHISIGSIFKIITAFPIDRGTEYCFRSIFFGLLGRPER